MNAREFLELVTGERCPCGHLVSEHYPPTAKLPGDFKEVCGACHRCECAGLVQ